LNDNLRLYPDPNSDLLKQAVAEYYGVHPAQVFLGNGSDEVLAHIFHGLFQHDAPLLFPDISYSFYPVYCGLYGIRSTRCRWTSSSRSPGGLRQAKRRDHLPQPERADRLPAAAGGRRADPQGQPGFGGGGGRGYIDFGGETAISLVDAIRTCW
jgi:histidinol-phosphate aminotransferase